MARPKPPPLSDHTGPRNRGVIALAVLFLAVLCGCGDEVVPTTAYSDPASIPVPTQVLALPSLRGALVRWEAPDSDFRIIQGWFVYKESPDQEVRRLTATPVQRREYEDAGEPQVGTSRYWVTALSWGGVESLPSGGSLFVFDEEPPAAPQGLQATPAPGSIILQWATGTEPDLLNYTVFRDGASLARVNDPSMPIFFDYDVVPGVTHAYVVTATDFRGHESPPSNEVTAAAQ